MVKGAQPETFTSSDHAAVTHTPAMIDVGLGDGKILQLPTATENKILKRGATAWELGDPFVVDDYVDGNDAKLTKTDSGGFNGSYPATSAYDNNDGTAGRADVADTDIWVAFEFPDWVAISGVRVHSLTGSDNHFYAEYKDKGGSWASLDDFGPGAATVTWERTWTPVLARFFRIRAVPVAGQKAAIHEIDIRVRR